MPGEFPVAIPIMQQAGIWPSQGKQIALNSDLGIPLASAELEAEITRPGFYRSPAANCTGQEWAVLGDAQASQAPKACARQCREVGE